LSKCRKSLDRTSTSPIPIGGNSQTRKLRYSPNLSESYNNNNNNNNNNKLNDIDEDLTTKAIQEKFPEVSERTSGDVWMATAATKHPLIN